MDGPLYPNEIDIEVVNHVSPVINIPPLAHAYFVLFLCAYHRRDDTQCEILGTLESMIYDNSRYGLSIHNENTFIILNMVGICYELLRDTQRAAFYYRKSVNMIGTYNRSNTYSEAAKIRLQLLAMKRE